MSNNNSSDDDNSDDSNDSQNSGFLNEHSSSRSPSESNGFALYAGEEDRYCKGDELNDWELEIILSKSVLNSINESTLDNTIKRPTSKKDSEEYIIDLFRKGKDEQKISFFQNKNKKNHIKIKQCIESQPEIVSTIIPFIHIHFCKFFDLTEEGLSFELLKLLVPKFEEKDANDFLWTFATNYKNLKEDAKEKAIELILLLFNFEKEKPKQQFIFLLGTLYVVARNLKEMLTNMKSIELVYSIINKKNEYINNMLFKLILDSANNKLFQIDELSFLKEVIIDKYNNDFEKCIPFNQLKNVLDKMLPKAENKLIESSLNLKEYLLSFINYNPYKDEGLTKFLLIRAKQQTFSQKLQDIAKENQVIINNILIPFLIAKIYELSKDKYAKFLVLEIIEHFPEEKLPDLMEAIKPQFGLMSIDKQGTRVIQSILNQCYLLYCNSSYTMNSGKSLLAIICLLKNISANIVDLMTNKYSANVVICLLKCQIPSINELLYQMIANNLMKIITTQFGCGRIKEILQLQINKIANYCHYLFEVVVNEINLAKIISDQYGHYFILYLLTIPYDFPYKNKILEYMRLNFILFAKQKYSSSIIEKCAEKTNLFNSQLENDNYVKELATHPIGFYILLSTIQSNEPITQNVKKRILKLILKNKKEIKLSTTGQSFLKMIKKYTELQKNNAIFT